MAFSFPCLITTALLSSIILLTQYAAYQIPEKGGVLTITTATLHSLLFTRFPVKGLGTIGYGLKPMPEAGFVRTSSANGFDCAQEPEAIARHLQSSRKLFFWSAHY